MRTYALTDYEPYAKALKKYEQLNDKYKKHIIPDVSIFKKAAEEAANELMEAQADNLIGEVDKKILAELEHKLEETEKRFKSAEAKTEKPLYERKIMEIGLHKLKQELETLKAEAIQYIRKQARQEHEQHMLKALNTLRELSEIWKEDRLFKANLQSIGVDKAGTVGSYPGHLDPGSENDPNGSTLFYFAKTLRDAKYPIN